MVGDHPGTNQRRILHHSHIFFVFQKNEIEIEIDGLQLGLYYYTMRN